MSFESLGLLPELLRAVREESYTVPTPVQSQAIPVILRGKDLMAGAQTGTGKTAAFTLPLLQRLADQANTAPYASRHPLRALILTPTRELAMQVEESVRTYGRYLPIRSCAIFGGVPIGAQIRNLQKGCEIVVATPGRLLDHWQQGTINFSKLEILILDEADQMLDMGFIRDIRKILGLLPPKRQNLLFSATFNPDIRSLAESLLNQPESIDVAPRNSVSELVSHTVHPVDRDKKRRLLAHLIKEKNMYQVLVFTRTKHGANHLAQHLEREGISASAIHGDKSQQQRIRALADFKKNKVQVLVATDIAARGLDIDQLPHVVNFELPNVPEDYIHRIGRTGRAGSEGRALSLVCVDEYKFLKDIEKLLKRDLPKEVIPGFEPDPSIRPEPIILGRRSAPTARGPRDVQSHPRTTSPAPASTPTPSPRSRNDFFSGSGSRGDRFRRPGPR